jgi:hypothetical protein
MEERSKYEKWLKDLEAKKESTPKKVFDRVRADYKKRLDAADEKLQEHTAEVEEHAATLMARLQELEDEEQHIREERDESELRAQVGELSAAEWASISRKADKDLAKLKENHELISEDLNRIRGLLGDTDDVEPEAEDKPTEPAKARSAGPRSTPAGTGQIDELEFLKSVVGGPTGNHPTAKKGPTPDVKAKAPAAAAPETTKPEQLVEQPKAQDKLVSKEGADPVGVQVTGANQIVLRSSGVTEVPKTLKCAECGSMNYPSEWYCERCGAELANV